MKKQNKSKKKRVAAVNRNTKRGNRAKATQKDKPARKAVTAAKKQAKARKFQEYMNQLLASRMGSEEAG